MKPISFKRHRFPADVIRHAVWLYFRLSVSFRDVEDIMAERGIEVSYETIRCWTIKFGPQFARALKKRRPAPSPRWHLDEMVCNVRGKRMYLWRAVDDEGEVLDLVMQRQRDTEAALKLLRRLLATSPSHPPPSSPTGSDPMVQPSPNWVFPTSITTAKSGKTTGPKTPTWPSENENGSSRGSSPKPPPRGFSPPTQPFTTPSTRPGI